MAERAERIRQTVEASDSHGNKVRLQADYGAVLEQLRLLSCDCEGQGRWGGLVFTGSLYDVKLAATMALAVIRPSSDAWLERMELWFNSPAGAKPMRASERAPRERASEPASALYLMRRTERSGGALLSPDAIEEEEPDLPF
jgi:hypothetical protein